MIEEIGEDRMITSTRSECVGKRVVKELGIVSGYDDSWRAIRMSISMTEYIQTAIKDMEKEAEKLGANGILGISFALGDSTKPVVIGTAILLEDE